MSLTWAKNHAGFSLSDKEMKDIPYPTAELGIHVTLKTVQAFSLIGTLIIGPIKGYRAGSLTKQMTRFGKWGVVLGLATGPAMTYARLNSINFDENGIYDRCYRLRHNRSQVRVDRGSIVGMVAGAGLFPALRMCPVLGSLVGMSTGVLAMAVYNMTLPKKSFSITLSKG
jgi:hypothetical protein